MRTYRTTKDNINRTGKGISRFQFFDKMDAFLGEKPTNSSSHTIDVATVTQSSSISDQENEPTDEPKKKRYKKNTTDEYINFKINYYSKKEALMEKNNESFHKYLEKSLDLKRQKLELYKRKVETEEKRSMADKGN